VRHQRDSSATPWSAGAFRDDPEQQLGADHTGVERIVRLGPMPDDRIDAADHLLRHIGMMIEPEHDRHAGPEHLPAQRRLLALDIVDPLRGAGAMQLQRPWLTPHPALRATFSPTGRRIRCGMIEAPFLSPSGRGWIARSARRVRG
jgi:hypothetical protein